MSAKLCPSLSNREAVNRFERGGITYFRQDSTVLDDVTLSFKKAASPCC